MVGSAAVGVRAGEHPCFDRLVVDVGGPAAGYRVEYVAHLFADPSGRLIPVRGGATLRIAMRDLSGTLTLAGRNLANVAGFRTFRQVVGAGAFEAVGSMGLGVRARLPFRVFRLSGPGSHSRLVIDVAHRWEPGSFAPWRGLGRPAWALTAVPRAWAGKAAAVCRRAL